MDTCGISTWLLFNSIKNIARLLYVKHCAITGLERAKISKFYVLVLNAFKNLQDTQSKCCKAVRHPFEIRNGRGAAEAGDQKCTCEWRNENLACLPWRVSGLVLDTGICFIFTVDIKLQNHLINFAFTVMNSTGVDGEVRKGNTSGRTFAFCGASGSNQCLN